MMLIVSSIQFTLATGHVITFLVQLIRAFIGAAGTLDGPSLYLLGHGLARGRETHGTAAVFADFLRWLPASDDDGSCI